MRLFNFSGHLFLLVMAWGSGVRGQPCPAGQITHIDNNNKQVRCCLPTDCEPNHYLKYCETNGTEDTCELCPANYGLYKRISSFAVEPCHDLYIEPHETDKCRARKDSNSAALEDMKNCYCNLEQGNYYFRPQITVGPSSVCQPLLKLCEPGFQPTQKGKCEPCPPNTVQSINGFKLCRPQRNCTALRLETKIPGNSSKEAVCASPPPLPSASTVPPSTLPRTSSPPPEPISTTVAPDVSVRTSVGSGSDDSLLAVVVVVCSVLVICLGVLVFLGHRKGWFSCVWKGKCYDQDLEGHTGPGSQMQLSSRDNDNTSDNSCYTCADSCLTSSNKNSSSAAKSGASACESPKPTPGLPMLEAYMNRNRKCPESLDSNGSMSEPFYNSISHDARLKLNLDIMPSYENMNGVPPPVARRDLNQYPNRVHPTSSDEDNRVGDPPYAQVQHRTAAAKSGREREEFSETDPLLPSSENCSSGVPTPVSTPALKGILRNGANRQEPKRNGGGRGSQTTGAQGGAEEGSSVGNRPHLSMLLNTAEDTSHLVVEESQVANLPHLSQLVSVQSSQQGPPGPQPQLHHQQLLQQQAPEPPAPGLERLPQQRPQQGSPLAARLVPVSSSPAQQRLQLNPSLVQMEELKPVMPLSPGPGPGPLPLSPTGGYGAGPQGREEHVGSPARISPTQQEVRAGGAAGTGAQRPAAQQGTRDPPAAVKKDVSGKMEQDDMAHSDTEATRRKEIGEETFRKQAVEATSPVLSEETMQKSVGGSSGLGDSLDFSSPLDLPSEEDGRSRTMYRRSNSEASRSVSPPHQLPPSRSISTPEEKHRPFAVVKPMQSDQSLNAMSGSQDRLTGLTQLEAAARQYPLSSLAGRSFGRQTSQAASSDDSEQTRPKTPDNLSEAEEEEEEEEDSVCAGDGGEQGSGERTPAGSRDDSDGRADRQGKGHGGGRRGN
ncbi:uncharacterized protein LOC143287481 [Babylonia areolata]|uniref:uncharacterized protein LOC143287481 n=1 Tax=Babylonia areolata TaxID=304850 RepID=UPI003FD0B267